MRKIKSIELIIFCLFFLAVSFATQIYGVNKGKDGGKLNKSVNITADNPSKSIMCINNITSIVMENGMHPNDLGGQSYNGEFPKGSQLGGVYQEGILWGGKVYDGSNPVVRVGGGTYSVGNYAIHRLVRVRPDYKTADLADDAASVFQTSINNVSPGQIQQVKDQYEKDWNEWPAQFGAPFDDKNGNGTYEPDVDIPGVPGASQTLWIAYNDGDALSLYASPQIGMEVQETYWAYAVANPLGNVIFKRVRMIYKGTASTSSDARIDSMYIAQFSDTDLGQYTDDYAGCVPDLNLGYAYNSTNNDAKYTTQGLVPPAMGYDFLQGAAYYTGNLGDSAIVNFKWKKGYKYFQDKPMSSFIYFAAGGNWSDPALVSNNGNYDNGTLQMYNLLRGYLPSPNYPAGETFPRPDRFGGPVGGFGTYLLDGDPATGSGWIDGDVETAGDRRILCINGPVSMKRNDTIEVVIALIGAEGVNNISSVSLLKYYDTFAQNAYDQLFNLPIMPKPNIQASALDQQIVLNWGFDENSIDAVEKQPHGDYKFQAYSIYQLPTSTTDIQSKDVKRVATFDVVDNVSTLREIVLDQDAGETYTKPITVLDNLKGIQRYFVITEDALKKQALINGQTYRFAITAIAYNEQSQPSHILESSPVIIDLTPHAPNPGTRYSYAAGDSIKAEHQKGVGQGSVFALIVDPSKLTGDTYKVKFDTVGGITSWYLVDSTKNKIVLTGQTNQTGDNDYKIVDGMLLKVVGPSFAGMSDYQIPNGTRRFTFANNAWASSNQLGLEGFSNSLGYGSLYSVINGVPASVSPADLCNTLLTLAQVTDTSSFNPTFNPADPNMSYGYRYMRKAAAAPAEERFAPYIVNAGSGYAFQDFTKSVPFSAWNVDDPANPKRLSVGYLENNVAGGLVDGKYWPPDYNQLDNSVTREFIQINQAPYTETADPNLSVDVLNNPVPGMWMGIFSRRGAVPFSPDGTGTDQFLILANHVNSIKDEFVFTAVAPTISSEDAKLDVNKVNVFPNPYYGYQNRETSREGHYVTFSHLPAKAVIRIFDLAGVMVRTIERNNATSQFEQWDLRNDNNYPVSSGIYIAYIDMPDLGKTKILKIALIQEVQVLPVY